MFKNNVQAVDIGSFITLFIIIITTITIRVDL